jgi:enoyl-CoA hydratase/carnithine racemase
VIREEPIGEGGRVLLVTLDRPERRNALRAEHWAALATVVRNGVDTGARAIVLTGAGSAFCAGADLNDISPEEMAEQLEGAYRAVREARLPVIAYVNGPAVGAGAQLALHCDLRVIAACGRFRIPAAVISMLVDPVTIRRLVEIAGMGTASAILLGADWVDAERAHSLGLADRIGELDDAVAWASEISGFAPLVLRYLKEQLRSADSLDSDAYHEALRATVTSEDFAEALRALDERRSPVYEGR